MIDGHPTKKVKVTATHRQRVYMLYIGVGDSPAILINYHPAG